MYCALAVGVSAHGAGYDRRERCDRELVQFTPVKPILECGEPPTAACRKKIDRTNEFIRTVDEELRELWLKSCEDDRQDNPDGVMLEK